MGDDRSRVFLVGDHAGVRNKFALVIRDAPGLELAGEADSIESALKAIPRERPDIVVVDLALGAHEGVVLVSELAIRMPETRILAYSFFSEPLIARHLFEIGARGYLSAESSDEEILEALRDIREGGRYIGHTIH
jgi:DNA-binding NarL/FixJ family response regulator